MKTFKPNAAIATDAYKLGHMTQYPENTTVVYSNFTPRSTKHSPVPEKWSDNQIVVYGIQATIMEMVALWNETFFSKSWTEVSENIDRITAPFVGDSGFTVGLKNFKSLHELGYLPVLIKSLPEGTTVSPRIPVMTIRNTQPDFFWLTGYLETYLSQQMWKMSTIATVARAYRKIATHYAKQTGTPTDFVDFQIHDFSARGLSGAYDNAMVGSAHTVVFKGTDSLLSTQFHEHFHKGKQTFIGGSVPATEHSVMTSQRTEGEFDVFKRILQQYPTGVVSIVSDSYDFWKVITEFTKTLKEDILARKPDSLGLAKVVFRPDSGDPVDIICGTAIPINSDYEYPLDYLDKELDSKIFVEEGVYKKCTKVRGKQGWKLQVETVDPTPEMKGAAECLWDVFGGTVNEKGYRELNPAVGLIYGDSITLTRADQMLSRLQAKGFASGNIVLGVGSYSYQMVTRDTFGYAMKSTYQEANGKGIAIYKDPATDNGTKKSATGLLQVKLVDNKYVLNENVSIAEESTGELNTLLINGKFENLTDLETIRTNLLASL